MDFETLIQAIRDAQAYGDILLQTKLLRQASELACETEGQGSARHIEWLTEYGGLLKYIGRTSESVEILQEALSYLDPLRDGENYAVALINLAGAYRFHGDPVKSEALYLKAADFLKKDGYRYASLCNNLGILCQDVGRSAEAAEYHERSLNILKSRSEWIEEYATTLGNLASARLSLGESDKAKALLDEAEEITNARPKSALRASILNQKALLLYHSGNYTQSLCNFEKAYAICKAQLGEQSDACRRLKSNIEAIRERMIRG